MLDGERGRALERPHHGRSGVVCEVAVEETHVVRPRAVRASSADASTQNSVGSPSRGNTTASHPFIPQKFVR